ncbi:MAG: methyltransferase domain-containing protein [Myxococcota bacterium]
MKGVDGGRSIDWGRTSPDYEEHRPGPPPSFYEQLERRGVGLSGQSLLDLGTGTGLVAREFSRRGARVAGCDISAEQIVAARLAAQAEGVEVDFREAPAEQLPFEDAIFDVAIAMQCWMYFDLKRVIPELRRVVRSEARIVVSHFSFLPRLDPIARASEALVLEFNPDWSGADWDGTIPLPLPRWAREQLEVTDHFVYDEAIPFTRESWRGRMRALRGMGATLGPDEIRRFNERHAELLEESTEESFEILHRIDAYLFRFRERA